MGPRDLAWGAAAICSYASLHSAHHVSRESPRLFGALALLGVAWAMLLPYYHSASQDELLAALSGIMLIFAGGPLRREAIVTGTWKPTVSVAHGQDRLYPADRWAVFLLGALAVPHVLRLPTAPDWFAHHEDDIVAGIGTVLTVLGYWSIVDGARRLTTQSYWGWLAFLAAVYTIIELMWLVDYLNLRPVAMDGSYLISFATAKVCFTVGVLIVLFRGRAVP